MVILYWHDPIRFSKPIAVQDRYCAVATQNYLCSLPLLLLRVYK